MTPRSGQGCEAFRNELITNFAIMSTKQFFEEFHLSFLSDEDPITKQPIEHNFGKDDFEMLSPGDTLFKLAAKSRTAELYETIEDNKGAAIQLLKQEIVNLSVTYQLLTKETAFIGVIKQDDKVIGELTKVVIPTTLSEQQQSYISPPVKMMMGY